MTKHTPTPWHRNISPASKYPVIFSGRNKHVAQVVTRGLSEDEIEANCRFIVEAVNNHEALKARVEEITEALLVALETLPNAKIKDNAFNVPEIFSHNETVEKAIGIVRDALQIRRTPND